LAGPIPVMPRANDSTPQVEDRVEVYHAGRSYLGHHSHSVENDCDHHGDKKPKESFHPKVDECEVCGREVGIPHKWTFRF
jgi:hypothetical protein